MQETKGPKLGSVSINLNSRSNAMRVFQRSSEISRSWAADVFGRQGVKAKWHKYQGIVSASPTSKTLVKRQWHIVERTKCEPTGCLIRRTHWQARVG